MLGEGDHIGYIVDTFDSDTIISRTHTHVQYAAGLEDGHEQQIYNIFTCVQS